MAVTTTERPRALTRPRRILAVGGAKGGAGKTVLATNLAVYLATIGRKVALVDADATGANAHTCLGVARPQRGEGNTGPFAIAETSVPGLRLLRAGLDRPASGATRALRRARLEGELRALPDEWVVVDLGSGTVSSMLDLYLAADRAVFVTTPEPTAMECTYRFFRAIFARKLRAMARSPEERRALSEQLAALGGAPRPLDLLRDLESRDHALAPLVRTAMTDLRPLFVLNQTRVRADLELGDAMRSASHRGLGLTLDSLGHVDYDDTVWTCVRARRPLLVESPGTKASKAIEKIARRLLALDSGKGRVVAARGAPRDSHHDLLEVDRGATDEEVRRAFKRGKEVYGDGSLACYGLFDDTELAALRLRLEEAYDVLLDPARRRPYELSVFPEEPAPQRAEKPDDSLDTRPPPPEITPDTEFHGPLLRAVRESQGLDLSEVSQRTKIGVPHLRAIESDDFGALPALVYVRGFVGEVAKLLKLDAGQVSRTYVRRLRRYLEDRARVG